MHWDVERLSGWRVPEDLRSVAHPVLYVEVVFASSFAEAFGVRLVEPPIDWLPEVPEEYRKRSVVVATLGEARKLSEAAFIKPPNDKSFPAKVYRGAELPVDFPDDAPVLISEVVAWEKEFRCYILDRQLRTFSIYLRDGALQRESGFESQNRTTNTPPISCT